MARFLRTSAAAPSTHVSSSTTEGMTASSTVNQFAILVSCRCNYTGIMGILAVIITTVKNLARILILIL